MNYSYYTKSKKFPGSWISKKARIETGTIILPGSIIGDSVVIGANNLIGPNVVIEGSVIIGNSNIIMPGVVIGMPSRQRLKYHESPFTPTKKPNILIGNDNIIHEGVTIRLPMKDYTIIEDNVVIGAKTHIANDCLLKRNTLIAANCSLGGYVSLGIASNLGLGVTIHPRVVVGAYAMCGLASGITRHVAPGATVVGVPARYLKPNIRGMERNYLTPQQIILLCDTLTGKPFTSDESHINSVMNEFISKIRHWGRLVGILPSTFKDPSQK